MNVQVSIFIYIFINQSESNLILISYIIPDGSKIQLRKHGNSTKSSRLYRRVKPSILDSIKEKAKTQKAKEIETQLRNKLAKDGAKTIGK
jgi:hypothetical protein